MKKIVLVVIAVVLAAATFLVGCAPNEPSESSGASASADEKPSESAGNNKANAGNLTVDTDLADMTWDDVLKEAEGQTVNFYMWGGNTQTNDYVDNIIGGEAKKYGVTINRVGVSDITEAINIMLGEKQAGKTEDGECDLLWINGANFMTAKQGDLLFGPFSESLENAKYVNWDDPAVGNDMGFPVNGYEAPWGSAQLQIIYDSERVSEEELPRNFTELMEWAKANPGRFTYTAIPEFYGTRFLKSGIYELTGGFEQYQDMEMTYEDFAEKSAPFWDWLEEINPYLWREGTTFPKTISDIDKLFSDNEVDFSMTLSGAGISAQINTGVYSETSKVYAMDTSITDTNYVAIAFNSGSKAGAMVAANIICEPYAQAQGITLHGVKPAIDISRLAAEDQKAIEDEWAKLPAGTYLTTEESARTAAPEVGAHLNPYIEKIWMERIKIS